jgi:prevent-host-death family protein
MQSVNAAELKSQLAHYLQQAQEGNEIIIKERNRIIARLVPPEPVADFDEELLALAAQGVVRLPKQPLTEDEVEESLKRKLPRLKIKGEAAKELMKRIWDEERGDY